MIRPININLNAAHPELPLVEATTFTGAPSSVFIRGVPKAVGNWSITAVSVAVTYPDNATTSRAAVESAEGVWVATIPGTASSGRTAAGFKIMADGIDENGAAVTGYVLGFADFSVLSFTPVPAPGGTFYLLRYFDQAPATPKEGDVAVVDGLLKMYNGTAWRGFGDGPGFSTDDPQMDGTASPGSAATAARSDHVHPTDTSRAADDAVVKLTGNQDIGGNKTFYGDVAIVNEKDLDVQGGRVAVRSSGGSDVALFENDRLEYSTDGGMTWTSIMLDNIAPLASPAFTGTPTAPTPSSGDDSTKVATTAFVQGAVPYALVTKTITNGAVTLDDRAHNVVTVAAAGSGNTTTITATLPPIVAGKSRDMFLNITVGTQASDAGNISLSIVEPSGATVQIDIGSVEDIGIGKNEILISENALPTTSGNVTTTHWLVTVRHEDFAS